MYELLLQTLQPKFCEQGNLKNFIQNNAQSGLGFPISTQVAKGLSSIFFQPPNFVADRFEAPWAAMMHSIFFEVLIKADLRDELHVHDV